MCSKVVGKEQNYTTWYRQLYSLHKTEGIYVEIAEDIEARFYTLNYELDRSLLKGKTKKSNWITEIWTRWKNNELAVLMPKLYSYLNDQNYKDLKKS